MDGDGFVHVTARPSGGAAIVEPQLIVRIPVGRSNPPTEMPGHPRDPVCRVGWRPTCERGLDFGGELRRHALVGVERQDPVVARDRRRVILLIDVSRPLADEDAVSVSLRDGDRRIRALRIDDDDFVRPGDRCQRLTNVCRFVAGDDRDRKLRHPGSLPEARTAPGRALSRQRARALSRQGAWRYRCRVLGATGQGALRYRCSVLGAIAAGCSCAIAARCLGTIAAGCWGAIAALYSVSCKSTLRRQFEKHRAASVRKAPCSVSSKHSTASSSEHPYGVSSKALCGVSCKAPCGVSSKAPCSVSSQSTLRRQFEKHPAASVRKAPCGVSSKAPCNVSSKSTLQRQFQAL